GEYVPDTNRDVHPQPLDHVASLYRAHGTNIGNHLSSIFALAIYETNTKRLTLLRDPCGARTLYYTFAPDGSCWFATQLRTLSHLPVVQRELSLPALRDYLTCFFVPGERTMWKDIYELRPGTLLALPERHKLSYWTPIESADDVTGASLDEYATTLRP